MVVFYDKIVSNSEANYIIIDDILVNKKELSDEINYYVVIILEWK